MEDPRLTVKGKTLYALYAFRMGCPQGRGTKGTQQPVKVRYVEILGHKGKLKWVQGDTELTVDMPMEKPREHAVTLKVIIA